MQEGRTQKARLNAEIGQTGDMLPQSGGAALHKPRYTLIYMEQKQRGPAAQGVMCVRTNLDERACDLAVYILENKATVRAAAKQFGVSKSTVHKDLTERLPRCHPGLYGQVRLLLDLNKAERHIRGGLATREKYSRRAEKTKTPEPERAPGS